MKKIILAIILICVLFSNVLVYALGYGEEWSAYSDSTTVKYSDVGVNYWAHDAIVRCSEKKWFGGYPDNTFHPEESITRAEALKVFVVFLGLDIQEIDKSSFYDVDATEWYAPYIEAGKDLFPVHTTIQGKRPFNPEMPVTREDTVYALINALGCMNKIKNVDLSVLNMFNDKNSISGDIKPYMAVALNEDLVSGYPDGTIRAQDPLSRSEFATLLLRGTQHGFSDNYEAKIQSVTIYPSLQIELKIGESVTLSALAQYTDNTTKEYNDFQPYDASRNGTIEINNKEIIGKKEGTSIVKFNDSFMQGQSVTVDVKKPDEKAVIKIKDYPESTSDNVVTVEGVISDSDVSKVELTCNGKDVFIEDDGTFSVRVTLSDGENDIRFIAINQYDNSSKKNIVIEKIIADSISETPDDEIIELNYQFDNMISYLDTSWGDDEFFLHYDFYTTLNIVKYGIKCWDKETKQEIKYIDPSTRDCDMQNRTTGTFGACVGSLFGPPFHVNGSLEIGKTYEWYGYLKDENGDIYKSDIQEFTFTDEGSRFKE